MAARSSERLPGLCYLNGGHETSEQAKQRHARYRRLAAILAADVAGYLRLIGADEGGTLQAFKTI